MHHPNDNWKCVSVSTYIRCISLYIFIYCCVYAVHPNCLQDFAEIPFCNWCFMTVTTWYMAIGEGTATCLKTHYCYEKQQKENHESQLPNWCNKNRSCGYQITKQIPMNNFVLPGFVILLCWLRTDLSSIIAYPPPSKTHLEIRPIVIPLFVAIVKVFHQDGPHK